MEELLKNAFDPERFRESGHEMVDQLADLLARNQDRQSKTSTFSTPKEELAYWRQYQWDSPHQFFQDVIDHSIHLHHPQYIGHQVAAPAPITALAGLMSDFLNNGMGVFEMGAGATAIEKIVTDTFCAKVGYSSSSDGFLTSGGTLANLTALLAARHRTNRISPNKKQYILVSEQAHYCIDRAATTMGYSPDQVIKIKTNDAFQISVDALTQAIEECYANDAVITAIVASACTTATGSYDDIVSIAALCQEHQIWMHIDGAHGGAVAWSDKYKHLIKGAHLADSIIIDAHKMMLVPALATAVLFREGQDSYKTFHQEASYLWSASDPQWYHLAKRTYETTKYMMSIKIFVLLKYYGAEIIDQFVTRQYSLTREFAKYLSDRKNFEIAHQPMANILCFRYVEEGMSEAQLNELNAAIRQRLLELGDFYIVQTNLGDNLYLRVTIMNPQTEMKDLEGLCRSICEIAKENI